MEFKLHKQEYHYVDVLVFGIKQDHYNEVVDESMNLNLYRHIRV